MQVVVLTDPILKEELLSNASILNEEIVWIENIFQMAEYQNAGAFIDLLFEMDHVDLLQSLLPGLVIVNSVEATLTEINSSFIRINGWPTFLGSQLIEASSLNENNRKLAMEVFALFHKKLEWLADEPGFVTARVISMIINEAFISLKEEVSTKEEINTAMKLGTNYPYGPFEWADKIGTKKIDSLLKKLNPQKVRYTSLL